MANRGNKSKPPPRRFEFSVPLLILLAFGLGAGTTWLIMRSSSSESRKPAIESFLPPSSTQPSGTPPVTSSVSAEPPDVSQLTPADAARTLGNWNYDRQDWPHAIEHYEQAIARGADTPDVRTDLGNSYRFLGQPQKALEQYQIAQNENPKHENSLFNQISLYGQFLHDEEHAVSVAREFLTRFPQSPRVDATRKQLSQFLQPNPSSSPASQQ